MLLPADPHDSPLGPLLTLGAEVEVTAQLSSQKARTQCAEAWLHLLSGEFVQG